MKKIAVTIFVLITFVIYSIHQRTEGMQAVQRVANAASAANSTNTTTQTATQPTNQPTTNTTTPTQSTSAQYKDGSYTGASSDAFYGYVQVRATVSGGKLTGVTFLDYPQDRGNSIAINDYAMPILKQQAIKAQSAQVDGVSGATDTSMAFVQSLSDALNQAKL